MLGQGGVMADHLGQVYERQGKRDAAVHAYQLAIAASPGMEDTRERLKNLGGPLEPQKKILTQKPGEKPFRVPPLSRSPGEELGNLRTTGIPELGRREGTAEFFLLFSAHKVEDAQFISGSDQLKTAASALLKAQYNVPFADDGPEKLVRRGILSCSPYTKPSCQFVFLQAGSATK
jgi:hypothetical protein